MGTRSSYSDRVDQAGSAEPHRPEPWSGPKRSAHRQETIDQMGDYRLSDLLDLGAIQKMADAHYRAAGMPVGIIDAFDGSMLVGAGWQDICVKFHRANPASCRLCRESDDYIKGHLVEGEACSYKCKNGLWDIGIPVVVGGRHLATMFLGQFFYEGEIPDREFFAQQAQVFGFDPSGYLAALDRVPVFSRAKVGDVLEYDRALVGLLAGLAEHSLAKAEAVRAVRESERKFHAIFDHAFQFLGVLSPDGRVQSVNRTALEFCQVEEADVVGRFTWETPWWAHSPAHQERLRLATLRAAGGGFDRFEATHSAADGSLHHVDFSLKPVRNEAGEVVLLIQEGRDISDRKRAEEEKERLRDQLAQAQKLEAVGRLAGGIAHDFNNMLCVIQGNVELAIGETGSNQLLREVLEEIQRAAERSAGLTRQLLAFARQQAVSPRVLELNNTVDAMLRMLRWLISEDIDLVWRPGHDLWNVLIDATQLEQILANLCVNARDAITGIGRIVISTENATVDPAASAGRPDVSPGDYVLLSVGDNGCGMDAATVERVFEPFFTTKEMGRGTGLGLSTVYGIVRQNNGFIEVDSSPGMGTTFRIYLPRSMGKPVDAPKQTGAGIALGRGETVLVTEDDSSVLKLTSGLLLGLGYKVMTAGSPEVALRMATESAVRIDLLITDVIMPQMNGKELAAKIRASSPETRCVFMSGYTADVIAHRGMLEPGVHFLHKPFSARDLAAIVRHALEAR